MSSRRFKVITTLCQESGVQIFYINTICFETQPRRTGAAVLLQAICLTWCLLHLSKQLPSWLHPQPNWGPRVLEWPWPQGVSPCCTLPSCQVSYTLIVIMLLCSGQLSFFPTQENPPSSHSFTVVLLSMSISIPLAHPCTCHAPLAWPFRLSWEFRACHTRSKGSWLA